MKYPSLRAFFAIFLLSHLTAAGPQNGTTTPVGCKKLNTDIGWPSLAEWQAALPNVVPAIKNTDKWGPLPDYRLQAKSIEDVQAAVRFTKQHDIRLTVLTTGHDQQARSDAGSGLIIDLSFFQGAKVLQSYTPTPEGQPFVGITTKVNKIKPLEGVQAAVSFGPAVAGLPLNYVVAESGLFTVSGGAATVAVAGGWGQNGGYGPMTSQYGLGVDQWLEALVVTPDGELRVANSGTNTDLFWAIRGGGGGTFGVVVQATWKAYPTVPITGYNWYINGTFNASSLKSGITPVSHAVQYLMGQFEDLQANNVSGTFYVRPDNIHGFAIHPGNGSGIAAANAIWEPILSHMQSLPGMTPFQTRPFAFDGYKSFFDGTYGPLVLQPTTPEHRRARGVIPYDSHLLAAEHLNSPDLLDALKSTGGGMGLMLHSPGMKQGDGSATSNTPAWRRAVALVIANKSNATSADGLRALAPDMGTYINEGSVNEPDYTQSFWGSNYARLSAIKRDIDPDMLLWVSPGINANYMHVVNGRVCRLNPVPEGPGRFAPVTERMHPVDMELDGNFIFGTLELTGKIFPMPGLEVGIRD
ncbi:hypothetical protein C7974DRAFT_381622 [Boeremia exigua]|uniref:uncharacterized protein n=1 Tax=Boeremia exigua TaxID=749465 RepID=UPI001E8D8A54|nr:uncharacterized protein C7974DRAFT_381622 [Boeremia exigua]KAH6611686.1 hypothetical protein C7974DRAFT_381622 [Boeremia exigua]